MTRAITIDLDTFKVLEIDGKILKGECKRCGKCCRDIKCEFCTDAYIDSYKDHEHTQPLYSCQLQNKKPFWCIVWPNALEDIRPDCGFHWEDKN